MANLYKNVMTDVYISRQNILGLPAIASKY